MDLNFDSEKPIYLQIADQIEEAIFIGSFKEQTQIPSTTELSTAFKINPATVLKGVNILVERGIIYKKRGVGMFVNNGAVKSIYKERENSFYNDFIKSVIDEAKKLKMKKEDIITLIERGFDDEYRN